MAAQEMVVPDLTSDNFDLLRFPSLPGFPSLAAENDDLNLMARMGSLFDGSAKPPVMVSSPQSINAGQQAQQQQQMHQHMRYRSPPVQQPLSLPQQPMPFSANTPGYPMRSPRSPASHQAFPLPSTNPPMMMTTPFALPAQTSFESERSQHNFAGASAQDALESDFSDQEDSNAEEDATPRRSSRKRNATQASREGDEEGENCIKPKKKVGRPITYNGDPNAPELTEGERRKVKRRIANRESARRVQQRRKEMIDELQHKLIYIQHHHHHLMQHLSKLELEKGQLCAHLTELKHKWTRCSNKNTQLHAQVASLQTQFEQQQQKLGLLAQQ